MMRVRYGRLWLVALGRPVPRSSRVAIHHAERDALWKALERSGVELPDGPRSESDIAPSSDVLQFGGYIELASVGDLRVALEVTRRENAVIFGRSGDHDEPDWMNFLASLRPLPRDSTALLRASIHQVGGEFFVARSFGRFDDGKVGAEVFAGSEVLNILELALGSPA
jgi:hypothetical protein